MHFFPGKEGFCRYWFKSRLFFPEMYDYSAKFFPP